jgi:hypothetical protein
MNQGMARARPLGRGWLRDRVDSWRILPPKRKGKGLIAGTALSLKPCTFVEPMLAPAGPQAPPCSQPVCPGLLSPEQPFGSITLPLSHSSSLRLTPDQAASRLDGDPHFPGLEIDLEEIWAG